MPVRCHTLWLAAQADRHFVNSWPYAGTDARKPPRQPPEQNDPPMPVEAGLMTMQLSSKAGTDKSGYAVSDEMRAGFHALSRHVAAYGGHPTLYHPRGERQILAEVTAHCGRFGKTPEKASVP